MHWYILLFCRFIVRGSIAGCICVGMCLRGGDVGRGKEFYDVHNILYPITEMVFV